MKDLYLKMGGDNIKYKESFLESSSYDYETKKMIKNWDSREPLYFQFELEEIEESQCFGTLNTLSENFKYRMKNFY